MRMPARAALAAVLLALSWAPIAHGASATYNTIYYAGLDGAGASVGGDAFVMRDNASDDHQWTNPGHRCSSANAVPDISRTITQLVGYSLGRMGPAYYLQRMEQRKVKSSVRNVVLLDPGAAGELVDRPFLRQPRSCDIKTGAWKTYATWLRQNRDNRLLILAAGRSYSDKYAGLNEAYLSGLLSSDVASRVLVCMAPNVKHEAVPSKFKSLIGGRPFSCPDPSVPSSWSPVAPGQVAPISDPGYVPLPTLSPLATVSASNNNGQMAVQLTGFPLGLTYYFCHSGGPADYPTGGVITGRGQFNVSSANQSFSSGLCSGRGNAWIGLQATDGHDYYSNQVDLYAPPTPGASISVFGANGQISMQVAGFPQGTTYYFCHSGTPAEYPTGGAIVGRGQINVTSVNQTFGPLCAGSGNAWIGVQATDGHDYYSNQIIL